MAKPTTWLESLLIWSIKHAPNGCQSQDPGLYLPILVMLPPRACVGWWYEHGTPYVLLYLREVASN